MSFDVFLQKFEAGKPAEASRERVLTVLKTCKYDGPDGFGFYIVKFPDGLDVEFSAKGLEDPESFTDCAFHIRGMSAHLTRFIFEIAKAGEMVILPVMEPFVPILSLPVQMNALPTELAENEPKPVLCSSADELQTLLSGGYGEWKKYRDQVVKRMTQ
jgi:hypothetical protein